MFQGVNLNITDLVMLALNPLLIPLRVVDPIHQMLRELTC
jgi:hypothetical protein